MYIEKEITRKAVIHCRDDNQLFCAKYCAFRKDMQCLLFSSVLNFEKIGKNQLKGAKRCDKCIEHFGTKGE